MPGTKLKANERYPLSITQAPTHRHSDETSEQCYRIENHTTRIAVVIMTPSFLRLLLPTLARIGQRLPLTFISAHAAAALEITRHLQWLTPPSELNGRSFAIIVEDLGLRCCFTCQANRFRPQWKCTDTQDLEISAALRDFASLARGSMDADTLFFQRRLKISGDTDLGLIVKNWLDATERPAWLSAAADY